MLNKKYGPITDASADYVLYTNKNVREAILSPCEIVHVIKEGQIII